MYAARFCGGLVALWLGSQAVAVAAVPPRPNVILIVADDLGAHDLGCYGSKFHQTPALDQMARDGLLFKQAYAACPVCSPTRAALMTGRHPARLHITDWLSGRPDRPEQQLNRPQIRQQLPLEEQTLAELFQRAGYSTGHFGKWHLGGEGFGPLEQGFQVNIGGDHMGLPLSYFAPFAKNGRTMPGLAEAPAGQYLTDRLTDEVERFITAHAEEPFFIYFPHYAVHTPLKAPAELVEKFTPEEEYHGQQNNAVYAAMLLAVDHSVGRVRAKLKELELDERTLIVFTSDNGGLATVEGPKTPATSNAPLREGKGWLYEGGVRVPMLVAGPGLGTPGRVADQPVVSHDLLPTFAALCKLEAPDQLDGRSILPILNDTGSVEPQPLYWHYPHYSNQGGRPGAAIRSGQYKLIEYYEDGRRELYDLEKDPRETQNLALSRPEIVDRLARELADWRTAVGAQMMTENPHYQPNVQGVNGAVVLPARTANVTGVMLRYEPLPHKNTLGFWTRVEDTAFWDTEIRRPGAYHVEALVGCGDGSGGSHVEFRIAGQKLEFVVPETGGFQKFVPQNLGTIQIPSAGRYRLEVVPTSKPGPAVMDLRQVRLLPPGTN